MAGDHKCSVCQATFTRPQHVARHMRSHTGDRPYKCQHCGDQFARSDLLSRHINKCHANEKPLVTSAPNRRKGTASASRATTSKQACDQCVQSSLPCDGANPCAKCVHRKCRCTYVKFHRQTAPQGPGHPAANARGPGSDPNAALLPPNINALPTLPPNYRLSDSFMMGTTPGMNPNMGMYTNQFQFPSAGGAQGQGGAPHMYAAVPGGVGSMGVGNVNGMGMSAAGMGAGDINPQESFEGAAEYAARYRAQAEMLSRAGMIPSGTANAYGGQGGQQWSNGMDYTRDNDTYSYNNPSEPFAYLLDQNTNTNTNPTSNSNHRRGASGSSTNSASHGRSLSQPSSAASSSQHLPLPADHYSQYSSSTSDSDSHHRPHSSASSQSQGQSQGSHDHGGQGRPQTADSTNPDGFHSAFGLMSLDDPAVLAGLSSGTPFFESLMNAAAQAQSPGGGGGGGNGLGGGGGGQGASWADGVTPRGENGMPLTTPSSLKELKEMWKQYMRTPLSGPSLAPLATPLAHSTSDQQGQLGELGMLQRTSPKRERGLPRVASMPSVKTPGVGAVGGWDGRTNNGNNPNGGGSQLRGTIHNPEDLRSYEQAVLARKTPLNLNFPPKRRAGTVSVSSGSGVGAGTGLGGGVGTGGSGSVGSGGGGSGGSGDDKSLSSSPQHPPSGLPRHVQQAMGMHGHALGHGHGHQVAGMEMSRPSSSSSTTSSLAHAFGQHAAGAGGAGGSGSDGTGSPAPLPAIGVGAGAGGPSASPAMAHAQHQQHHDHHPAAGLLDEGLRPSFKRLPSQTLGPDYSKRAAVGYRAGGYIDDGDEYDGEDMDGGSYGAGGRPMGPPAVPRNVVGGGYAGAGGYGERTRRMSAPTSGASGMVFRVGGQEGKIVGA